MRMRKKEFGKKLHTVTMRYGGVKEREYEKNYNNTTIILHGTHTIDVNKTIERVRE